MIKNSMKILGIIVLAIIQLTLMPYLGLGGVWPNLVLIIALVLALLDFDFGSLLTAVLGGLILDIASPLFFGYYSLTLIASIVITKLVLTKFLTDPNIFVSAIILIFTVFLNDLLIMAVARNFIWFSALVNCIYSAFLGFFAYRFIEKWFKKQPIIKMSIK